MYGAEASRTSADMTRRDSGACATGVREVVLLGQNVNSYSRGRMICPFPDLLRRWTRSTGIERIRFVTSHPKDLSDELIDCFGGLAKLCEHIHLPFQSGSNKILRLMNRGYTAEEYREKIEKLKHRCGDIAITADCIVGFPGEDEEDFRATMEPRGARGFDGVFSFCFSPRPPHAGLRAAHRVPADMARGRLHELQALQKGITRENFKEWRAPGSRCWWKGRARTRRKSWREGQGRTGS